MKKTCFIIMPISDNANYPKGHFKRVYEHIIKPACVLAEFDPIRADDVLNTNHIALDILKKIIDSDMAICDLSSQNPNVLYELGIRQAFNKPVALIKDTKTSRVFDIQGFRDLEYDENLRIDNVQEIVENLSEIIKITYSEREHQVNSLVKLLGINPAELSDSTNISVETELILNQLSLIDRRLNLIENSGKHQPKYYLQEPIKEEPLFDEMDFSDEKFTPSELANLKKGDKVAHIKFGIGTVLKIEGDSKNLKDIKGEFNFERGGKKRLLLRFANLYKVL
ncbi:hypothetical protein [Flagellimonas zhangzhouensis]|uniref:Nucleoside 2-deoxyribosyltransferase n=1 Tax=Flagellimonas zhangzhouensis TaxID=1073328 RepID=A0A1H2SE70_9FLAO|nr:hypothetical protein [Allomuricauda zhangzhouensis]SDQ73756.1 hypothetical protein SAMN05216294_2408 [Allomuricauda zhangzhouensis]SDW29865.1 hypothetical protein SAMN04487892_1054 [Allomuricauda zhangzhouensis]